MHDTRRAVLETIRDQGGATVASLAEALGISLISVRHHLTGLQAEGLVSVELQRQPVGRPKHVYFLTASGQRALPNAYHVLAERLLDELKASFSPDQVRALLDRLAANMAARHGGIGFGGTLEERLERVVEILGEGGFRAAIHRVNESTVHAELNCPYVYVGQRHPEVCQIDHTILQSVLGQEVQRTSCVLKGDKSCVFAVEDYASIE